MRLLMRLLCIDGNGSGTVVEVEVEIGGGGGREGEVLSLLSLLS